MSISTYTEYGGFPTMEKDKLQNVLDVAEGGSGGGGGTFLIHITDDGLYYKSMDGSTAVTLDKTYEEIQTAIDSGLIPVVVAPFANIPMGKEYGFLQLRNYINDYVTSFGLTEYLDESGVVKVTDYRLTINSFGATASRVTYALTPAV